MESLRRSKKWNMLERCAFLIALGVGSIFGYSDSLWIRSSGTNPNYNISNRYASGNFGVSIGTANVPASGTRLLVNGGAAIGYSAAGQTAPTNGLAVSGRVGIGTTGPVCKLQIESAANTLVDFGLYQAGADKGRLAVAGSANQFFQGAASGDVALRAFSGNLMLGADNGNHGPAITIKQGGYVGIGTVPSQKLEVAGNMNLTGTSWFGYNSIGYFGTGTVISTGSASDVAVRSSGNLLFSSGGTGTDERMRINTSGCVGIGTTTPQQKLHSQTTGRNDLEYALQLQNPDGTNTGGTATGILLSTETSTYGKGAIVYERQATWARGALHFLQNTEANTTNPTLNNAVMTILNNGNVGIGTTSTGSYKLAVEGKIGAREVVVTTGTWSDFVFNNDYKLKPLNEVENYIKTHRHLEGIPTEKDVKAKGVAMGDMQAKLLQKIEELTLYTVELNKKTVELNEKVNQLTLANKELKNKINGK